MKEKEYVRTAIRWRRAVDDNDHVILKKLDEKVVSIDSHSKVFCFENVLDSSDQSEVYDVLVKPLVDKAFDGYDCTFLATGQTGSGKTYTLGFENSTNSENSGMTARVLNSIFSHRNAKLQVSVSFVEVYNDQAFDLFGPKSEPYKKDHKLSDSIRKSVRNEMEALALLSRGTKHRRVRVTNVNASSSRSHAVCTIYLAIEHAESKMRESVINLVDLAGSECVSKTGNTGKGQIEGKNINESLSAFKRVIIAMSSGASHIPFRDAVITNILRDSLRAESCLTLLGCVSPFKRDLGATLSTLSFVAEAKSIKRTPQLNAIIDKFQEPKTRTTMSKIQTPNSSIRATTPYRRTGGSTLLRSIQTKSSLMNSEPRNSSPLKRLDGKSIITTTNRNMRSSLYDRSNLVSALPAGQKSVIDDTANINWNEAFTSSPRHSTRPVDERSLARWLQTKLDNERLLVNNENRQDIQEILGKLTILLQQNAAPTQPSTPPPVVENGCNEERITISNEAAPANDDNVDKGPIEDQIALINSTNEPDVLDPIPMNVSVTFDHFNKRILFEVNNNKMIEDETITFETSTQPSIQPMQLSSVQSTSISKCDSSSIKETVEVTPSRKSFVEADSSINDTPNEWMVLTTPPHMKKVNDQETRTPIGKLVIRKVAHSNQFENTRYAVEVVQRQPVNAAFITPIETKPFLRSSAVARKADCSDDRVSKYPRLILHRVSTIDEYLRQYGASQQNKTPGSTRKTPRRKNVRIEDTQQPSPMTAQLSTRKTPRKKTVRIKDTPQPTPASMYTRKTPRKKTVRIMDPLQSTPTSPQMSTRKTPRRKVVGVVDTPKSTALTSPTVSTRKTPRKKNVCAVDTLRSTPTLSPMPNRKTPRKKTIRVIDTPQWTAPTTPPLSTRKTPRKRTVRVVDTPQSKPTSPPISTRKTPRRKAIRIMDTPQSTAPTSPPISTRKTPRKKTVRIVEPLRSTPTSPPKSTRKTPRKKAVRTEDGNRKDSKAMPEETDLSRRVMDILNAGNEKDLQKLATIGAKKASQIFIYRNARGPFTNLDGLMKMPFWSEKMHDRFISNNIFV